MKKKFGAVIMAAAMACTLIGSAVAATGCTTKIPDFVMPEGGFDTETPVEIKFYHTMGANLRTVLQNYIDAFNVLYPNIKVIEDQIGGYEDVRDQVVTEINSGAQPNLAYCYPDHVAMFNQSGAVLPLNGFLPDGEYKDMKLTRVDKTEESLGFTQADKDAFIEGYWNEGFQFDDGSKMYTLPFSKSTEVLFYNEKYFADHNLSVPKTWDEMEQVCAAIKANEPDNCIPLGYDSEANWFITMCEQLGTDYTSADGKHFLFDNEENRAFVTKFKGWYEKGYFITKEINKTYTSNLFKEKTSYMCIGSSAGAKNQLPDKVNGVRPFSVGVASITQVDPENPKVISQGPSICIFKQENP
ncbi:MAG: extracellular solute-binding protein, partial [Clostridiales bacterium]|nr:extracellular solute-binding protein [Clostridiales bacterium]